jgi:hypothetical protein
MKRHADGTADGMTGRYTGVDGIMRNFRRAVAISASMARVAFVNNHKLN